MGKDVGVWATGTVKGEEVGAFWASGWGGQCSDSAHPCLLRHLSPSGPGPFSPCLSPAQSSLLPAETPQSSPGRLVGPPLSVLGWSQVIWVLFLSPPLLAKSLLTPAQSSSPEAKGAVDLEQQKWYEKWGSCKGRAVLHRKILAELASSTPTITTRALF